MAELTGKIMTAHMGDWNVGGLGMFEFRMCGDCGVVWGVPEQFLDLRRADGKTHFCPNGHRWYYSGETVEAKLRRELETTKNRVALERAARDQARAEANDLAASLRTTKGHVTRMRNKAQAGVCPVQGWKRHFADLQRHMASKHPEIA